ncbi:transmembrane protein, putative [Medicago truncatula]|uniref:Transmembrane protein, putative n=1 Tax=Medicago truncatula TaxID=3880 RepID=G7K6X5_MEDTR|nr:transmembrane protein, putative [Medicago truncatula]
MRKLHYPSLLSKYVSVHLIWSTYVLTINFAGIEELFEFKRKKLRQSIKPKAHDKRSTIQGRESGYASKTSKRAGSTIQAMKQFPLMENVEKMVVQNGGSVDHGVNGPPFRVFSINSSLQAGKRVANHIHNSTTLILSASRETSYTEWGEVEDVWWWAVEERWEYSIRSSFKMLKESRGVDGNISPLEEAVFEYLWKSMAPSKVVEFYLLLLLDRISRRVQIFCCAETSNHLFLHCEVALKVCSKIMRWLGLNFLTHPNLLFHLESWGGDQKSKKFKKGIRLIWHAVIWRIWKDRNDKMVTFMERGIHIAL